LRVACREVGHIGGDHQTVGDESVGGSRTPLSALMFGRLPSALRRAQREGLSCGRARGSGCRRVWRISRCGCAVPRWLSLFLRCQHVKMGELFPRGAEKTIKKMSPSYLFLGVDCSADGLVKMWRISRNVGLEWEIWVSLPVFDAVCDEVPNRVDVVWLKDCLP